MKNNTIVAYSFSFVCLIFIICFAVVFTVNYTPLYEKDVERYHIDEYVGLSKETIMENYDALISYQSIFYKDELCLPDFEMSKEGRIHFEEVKVIFEVVQYLCIITGILSLVGLFYYLKNNQFIILKYIANITFFVPLIIGGLVAISFDKSFVLFHKLMFNNEYWVFDAISDPIITILPQEFFMHCFYLIVGVVFVSSLTSYIAYRYILNKQINKKVV